MTIEALTAFLLAAFRDSVHPLLETTLTQCLLRAYALGLEHGRKEAHAVAQASTDRHAEQRAHDRAVEHQRREEDSHDL